jgi:hypothetical protein
MDYYKIYTEQYDNNYIVQKKIIENELIKFKEKSKGFTFAHDTISQSIYVKIEISIISKNSTLSDLLHHFKASRSNYSQEFTRLSLENETYDKYNLLDKGDLPADYSFELFTRDLALLMSATEINRLFSNHSNLFQMMYELNNFKNFEINHYDNIALEDTPLFKKLHKTLYPNQYLKIVKATGEIRTSKYEDVDYEIGKFSTDEKILLLHICQKSCHKIPITEYSKIMLIANNINDFRLFIEEPGKNYFYNRMNKGLEAYTSIDKKRELINSVIDKIEFFNLSNINRELTAIKKNLIR